MPEWKLTTRRENMTLAVMGCVVNGRANRAMPTSASRCRAPARRRRAGVHRRREGDDLRGEHIAQEFVALIDDYVQRSAAARAG
jgi:(E)-4-hydroxy-3-methylbut-2-enyl-diphosphate synthase